MNFNRFIPLGKVPLNFTVLEFKILENRIESDPFGVAPVITI